MILSLIHIFGDAVEKLKADSQEKDMVIGGLYQQVFALKTAARPDSSEPLICFEEGLAPIRLRQLCTLLYEQNKGGVVLVCSGTGNEYSYALGSGVADMRALSKALNGKLSGRGGGSALMAQGTFKACLLYTSQALCGNRYLRCNADRIRNPVRDLAGCLRRTGRTWQDVYKRQVGMCGEAASDPMMIPLLLAFGLNEFSMSASAILRARKMVTEYSVEELKAVADKAMSFATAAEVEQYMKEFVENGTV